MAELGGCSVVLEKPLHSRLRLRPCDASILARPAALIFHLLERSYQGQSRSRHHSKPAITSATSKTMAHTNNRTQPK